jgi:hypothetical protein
MANNAVPTKTVLPKPGGLSLLRNQDMIFLAAFL